MARRLAVGLRSPPRDVRDRDVRGAGRAARPVLEVVAIVALRRDAARRPFGMTLDEGLEIGVGDLVRSMEKGGTWTVWAGTSGRNRSRCVVPKRRQSSSMR